MECGVAADLPKSKVLECELELVWAVVVGEIAAGADARRWALERFFLEGDANCVKRCHMRVWGWWGG